MIKKTVIITGYKCNNNCIFCIDSDKRRIADKSTKQIKKEIIEAKNRGTTYLELIGGETLIRPDIFSLIAYADKIGFNTIAMATNGRMLAYNDVAEKLVKAGLNHIIFSIHGSDSDLHDRLTASPGSFEELCKGFENAGRLLGLSNIGTNTTITRQNMKQLPDIGRFISGLGVSNAEFIFVDPNYGAAYHDFDGLVPRISEAAPHIKACLDIGREADAAHWSVRYVPLCYFTDYLDQVSELKEVRNFRSVHVAPDFENFNVEQSRSVVGRIRPEKCSSCRLHGKCEGIWSEYLRRCGDDELLPV